MWVLLAGLRPRDLRVQSAEQHGRADNRDILVYRENRRIGDRVTAYATDNDAIGARVRSSQLK